MNGRRVTTRDDLRFVLFLTCVLVGIGCGKKAPPLPPDQKDMAEVKDLKMDMENERVKLTWSLPEIIPGESLSGFSVYRSKKCQDAEACSTCPKLFEKVADIRMEERDAGELTKQAYHEDLEKGCFYAYQVSGYDKNGAIMCKSNVIEFSY